MLCDFGSTCLGITTIPIRASTRIMAPLLSALLNIISSKLNSRNLGQKNGIAKWNKNFFCEENIFRLCLFKGKKIVSLHPQFRQYVYDSVAQPVEHNTFNVGVLGSNPSWITKTK